MSSARSRLALATLLLSLAPAAQAQGQSEGYKFLEAVRDEKGSEIETMLNKPGSVVINTRSVTDGETPLHVVTKAGNIDYLNYLLSRGANPNVRDNAGTAPLVLAAERGREDLVRAFIKYKANVNYGNSNGETALIKAVRRRDLALIRTLLEAGANPDQADLLAGMSARDYAAQDTRAPAVAKELAATPVKPKAAVSGPRF